MRSSAEFRRRRVSRIIVEVQARVLREMPGGVLPSLVRGVRRLVVSEVTLSASVSEPWLPVHATSSAAAKRTQGATHIPVGHPQPVLARTKRALVHERLT